jgi:hypothetical protein
MLSIQRNDGDGGPVYIRHAGDLRSQPCQGTPGTTRYVDLLGSKLR